MTEEEKIKIAKTYITKLANGINPLDDMIIPESDIINNVHISRCLFYVADILEEMTDDKTEIQKGEFYISDEDIQKFTYSETPLTLTKIIKKINAINTNKNVKKIRSRAVINRLIDLELLYSKIDENGKEIKIPTGKGVKAGITMKSCYIKRKGMSSIILYDKNAQKFIVDNANYMY